MADDDLIGVIETGRICEWRTVQAVYSRLETDPTFPRPVTAGRPMQWERLAVLKWQADRIARTKRSKPWGFISYPGDDELFADAQKET